MRESIYDILMRALGVQNPPSRFDRTLSGRRKTNTAPLYEHTPRMTGANDMDELYNNRDENNNDYVNDNDYNDNNDDDGNNDNYNNDEDDEDDDDDNMTFMFDDHDGYLDSIIAHDICNDVNDNNNSDAENTHSFHS